MLDRLPLFSIICNFTGRKITPMHRNQMKFSLPCALCLFFLCSCSHPDNSVHDELYHMQGQISNLRDTVRSLKYEYRPSLGELMSRIQMQHAKLWFGGLYANWPLAYYELSKMRETFGEAVEMETDRYEVHQIPMIYPSLDSISEAISLRNPQQFKRAFLLMTNNCNSCHQAVKFQFDIVTVPKAPPETNQNFMPAKP
jgi:hypothetical protein